jgi:hypothetical protein|tara:strand:- start:239 stop:625 length:387 start_codon:yes stop_codon:yes gene_type:complete
MAKEQVVTEGVVAFCNLAETEKFNGQDTGRYSVVINMTDEEVEKVKAFDVQTKEYNDQGQRSFKSKYPVTVVDIDGNTTDKRIPYGSKVRLLWSPGPAHPQWGVPAYLNKVKVLELSDNDGGDTPEEF